MAKPGIVRISLDVAEYKKRVIDQIMKDSGTPTLVELFRKSLGLFQLVHEHIRNGGKLVLEHKDGTKETLKFM